MRWGKSCFLPPVVALRNYTKIGLAVLADVKSSQIENLKQVFKVTSNDFYLGPVRIELLGFQGLHIRIRVVTLHV